MGTILTSNEVFKNNETLVNAKLIATYTGTILFDLSVDGSNWEEDIENEITILSGTELYWRARGNTGAILTNVEITYTTTI